MMENKTKDNKHTIFFLKLVYELPVLNACAACKTYMLVTTNIPKYSKCDERGNTISNRVEAFNKRNRNIQNFLTFHLFCCHNALSLDS